MKFEWDPNKAGSNKKKHGFGFDEAMTAFDDPHRLIVDSVHSKENRKLLIGETDAKRVIVTVFTVRGGLTRIISARPASRKERKTYVSLKRVPL